MTPHGVLLSLTPGGHGVGFQGQFPLVAPGGHHLFTVRSRLRLFHFPSSWLCTATFRLPGILPM